MSAVERLDDQDTLIALPRDITMPGLASVPVLRAKRPVQLPKRGIVPRAANDYVRCLRSPPTWHDIARKPWLNSAHRGLAGHPCRTACGAAHDRLWLHR